jgi:hypothetical protein
MREDLRTLLISLCSSIHNVKLLAYKRYKIRGRKHGGAVEDLLSLERSVVK